MLLKELSYFCVDVVISKTDELMNGRCVCLNRDVPSSIMNLVKIKALPVSTISVWLNTL